MSPSTAVSARLRLVLCRSSTEQAAHSFRRALRGERRRGHPARAPLGRGRVERRRIGERHQGRREDRRFHSGGPECGCMTCPTATRGHFGPYGGVFVAETLHRRARRAARGLRARAQGSRVPGRVQVRAQALRRPPEPGLSRKKTDGEVRRRAHLHQARGPEPHRRAQDQQHHRPGAARARHEKPRVIAETGAGMHGVATATVAARYGMECVVYMGVGGREAPGGQRASHGLLGAKVVPVESGSKHAEGRAQRGDARLGHQRRQHVLHHRHRRRPASLSDDGARLPVGDRRGKHRADAGACRPPARRRDRLRRRRLQRDGHLLSVHPARERAADRRRSRGRGP